MREKNNVHSRCHFIFGFSGIMLESRHRSLYLTRANQQSSKTKSNAQLIIILRLYLPEIAFINIKIHEKNNVHNGYFISASFEIILELKHCSYT